MSTPDTPLEPAVRQDPDTINRRGIALVTIASIVIMALALVAAWALLEHSQRGREVERAVPSAAPRTIGMLEQAPILGTGRGLDLRARQEADLHRFGWVDRDAGIARIPIEDAVDLLVAHPLPPDRPLVPRSGASSERDRDRAPAQERKEGR
ncbi:MAG: hypothetical protein BGO98_38225 [Myxococcales bacterium 68-20]|nr:hypothetical protein [Myxococcales bacterium]OJY20410.1 MAG: hypothetical protein BGO98_38225 [Myxococcales bacterium 68-20]